MLRVSLAIFQQNIVKNAPIYIYDTPAKRLRIRYIQMAAGTFCLTAMSWTLGYEQLCRVMEWPLLPISARIKGIKKVELDEQQERTKIPNVAVLIDKSLPQKAQKMEQYTFINIALCLIMFSAPLIVSFGTVRGCTKAIGKLVYHPETKILHIQTERNIFANPLIRNLPLSEVRTVCELTASKSSTDLSEVWTVYPNLANKQDFINLPVNSTTGIFDRANAIEHLRPKVIRP